VSRVATVRGGKVDGEAAVITETFEMAAFPFFWVSLPSTPRSGLVQLEEGALDDAVGLLPDFSGAEEEADCLF